MEQRSLGKPEKTRSSSLSNRQKLRSIQRNKTSVQSFRPNHHIGKKFNDMNRVRCVLIYLIKYNVEFSLFFSFAVAQICPPSQNYIPIAPITDLSAHIPSSPPKTFNYDTPPPSYDTVRNQVHRGTESSQYVPTHSTSKFDQLRYL